MSSLSETLLLRVDSGGRWGVDKLLRCVALAQAWQDSGGRAVVLSAAQAPQVEACLAAQNVELLSLAHRPGSPADAQQTVRVAETCHAACLVADGSEFRGAYQRTIKQAGLRLMVFDDGGSDHFWADFVLNPRLGAEPSAYSCEPSSRLLLGPRYVLLRREFLRWRDWQRTIPAVARRVLVSFDAAAYPAAALRIVEVLGQAAIEDLEVVLIGLPDRAQSVQLEDAARGYSIRLQVRPNAARMPALLTQADAVVGAADLSCYEQLFMGMPSLLIPLEADQQARAAELAAHGAAVNLGPPERLDVADAVRELLRSPARREAMLGACRRLIDGYGAVRACMHLRGEKLWLRKTTMDDAEQLWKWANDPDVRANSFSHEPIQWHSHLRWLANKLADPNAFPFVAFDETDAPIGRLRFDTRGQQAKVSLAIGKEHRGAGYGSALLKLALSQLFRHTTVRQVHAFIRPANVVSIRLFERAGFQRLGIETIAGSDGLHYVKRA